MDSVGFILETATNSIRLLVSEAISDLIFARFDCIMKGVEFFLPMPHIRFRSSSMTIFGHPGPKALSSGTLWQEGAVSASRLMEKYMSQEEQLLHLSDLYQISHADYDRNGTSTQLLVTESSNDAGTLSVDPNEILFEGSLVGTTFLWRSVGNRLYLWDNADKSHTRSCQLTPNQQPITAVSIAKIPVSVQSNCSSKQWLIVATVSSVSLYYFDPDTVSPESPPVLSGYVAPTGGTIISCIGYPTKSGRIFLGGTDGSVFEFIYINQPPSAVSLFGVTQRRCYLFIITKPWGAWLGPIRSLLGLNKVSGNDKVLSMSVDGCRGLLYVLKRCGVEIYNLDSLMLQCDLSAYSVGESIRSAQRSSSVDVQLAHDQLVDLIPSNPHIGGDVFFVLVTRSGARVFVKRGGAGLSGLWSSSLTISTDCKFCQPSQLTKPTSVSIACVKLPERHPQLNIVSAYSPNGGRCVFMVSSQTNNIPSGIVVVRPEESVVVGRQQGLPTTSLRERYDFVPLGSVDVKYTALVPSPPVPVLIEHLSPSDALYSVAVDDLRIRKESELVVVTSDAREIGIRVPRVSEIIVDFLSSIGTNLIAARDGSMQYGGDQFAAQLFSILSDLMITTSSHQFSDDAANRIFQVERILFDPETATAMGFVESTIGSRRWTSGPSEQQAQSSHQLLGSVVHSTSQTISNRTRGLALWLSRLVRPIWIAKAFKLEFSANSVMTVRPILSSTQRTYIVSVIKPFVDLMTTYRQQLLSLQHESKILDGLMVLGNAILECMEMFRLFETGQLTPQGIVSTTIAPAVFANIDTLCVRDIVLSVGVGNELLMDLVAVLDGQGVLRKHCPLLVPRI